MIVEGRDALLSDGMKILEVVRGQPGKRVGGYNEISGAAWGVIWSNSRIGRLSDDGPSSGIASADVLDDIAKKGVIKIGIFQDFPPFASLGADLKVQGYDTEIADKIAQGRRSQGRTRWYYWSEPYSLPHRGQSRHVAEHRL